jgi:hypothetical protein
MAKTSRANGASNGESAAPIGGKYYKRYRTHVSGAFIEELKYEGVSAGTIHAIERDNAKRAPRRNTRGAADAPSS